MTVGRFVERKGVADILEALALLPRAELVVAGGPPAGLLDEDAHARRLVGLAGELGVSHRVQLLGAVPRAEMPAVLGGADVVCLYPWYEPFGIVAVEAMACGVPVVASDTGGLAETVLDGLTGRLVRPRAPAALAEALADLLEDGAARRAMGCNALRRASCYGWDAIAADTLASLAALARRGAPLGASLGAGTAGPVQP